MKISYNSEAEDIMHQQQVCDRSDVMLLAAGGTGLLIGNVATYAMLMESPTVGSTLRWGAALLLTTLSTAVTLAGRNHEYDVLDALRGTGATSPMTGQQG